MNKKAFTFLEVMIVIAIISVSLGLIALYAQTTQLRTDLNSQKDGVISYLRLAQSNAESGKNGTDHGIHLESDSYTMFEGSTYIEEESNNFKIELPNSVTIQNIALNGGGIDIVFNTPAGETANYGTFDLYSSQIEKSIQITINQFGLITY